MVVFNKTLMEATIETLAQEVDKFNAASNGTISLTSEGFMGDFFEKSFYASLHTAQRRVDRYGANGAQAATVLSQLQENSVKIAGGFGPITFEPAQMTWINSNPAEAIEMMSRTLAEVMIQDQLNSGIASAVAAIENVALLTNDVSATAGINQSNLNDTHALFGDSSMMLVGQIMTGTTYHNLVGQNLTNATNLYESTTVTVVEILGKKVIVTDAPSLRVSGTPNKQKVLSLVSGAVTVMDGSDVVSNIETANGKERIETTMQADYTFGLGLKGFSWDTANGGKSPTDAELATGTNWDQVVSSIKHTAGVITIGDEAKS